MVYHEKWYPVAHRLRAGSLEARTPMYWLVNEHWHSTSSGGWQNRKKKKSRAPLDLAAAWPAKSVPREARSVRKLQDGDVQHLPCSSLTVSFAHIYAFPLFPSPSLPYYTRNLNPRAFLIKDRLKASKVFFHVYMQIEEKNKSPHLTSSD